jgi:hypothetical protein
VLRNGTFTLPLQPHRSYAILYLPHNVFQFLLNHKRKVRAFKREDAHTRSRGLIQVSGSSIKSTLAFNLQSLEATGAEIAGSNGSDQRRKSKATEQREREEGSKFLSEGDIHRLKKNALISAL